MTQSFNGFANISPTVPLSGRWIGRIRRRAYIDTPLRTELNPSSAAFDHDIIQPRVRHPFETTYDGVSENRRDVEFGIVPQTANGVFIVAGVIPVAIAVLVGYKSMRQSAADSLSSWSYPRMC